MSGASRAVGEHGPSVPGAASVPERPPRFARPALSAEPPGTAGLPDSTARWGLVLGGGGVLGGAWLTGALAALEQVSGRDVRDAAVIIGTSAGAFTAALLGAGVSVDALLRHQLGEPVESGPLAGVRWDYATDAGGAVPPTPARLVGSPRLLAENARRLRRLPPTAVMSALVPEGRGSTHRIGETVAEVLAGRPWCSHPGVRVVALDYGTGARTVFTGVADRMAAGRQRLAVSTEADLPRAVRASCAIPGWYAPVDVGRRRYVDGAAWSSTNVDLVAGDGLDEVVVLSPMVSFATDRPRSFGAILDRQWRQRVTERCLREAARVDEAGTGVTILGPGPEDLELFGGNLMDPRRRLDVLRLALRTAAEALADPAPLPHPTRATA